MTAEPSDNAPLTLEQVQQGIRRGALMFVECPTFSDFAKITIPQTCANNVLVWVNEKTNCALPLKLYDPHNIHKNGWRAYKALHTQARKERYI